MKTADTPSGQTINSLSSTADTRRQAELTAVLDAMLQSPETNALISTRIIEPLAREQRDARDIRARKAAATKVEFFTMVRGEG
jgi:alpha-D-ribose 1-methylphosphonate 5-triphosphate synthase subunit PhnG